MQPRTGGTGCWNYVHGCRLWSAGWDFYLWSIPEYSWADHTGCGDRLCTDDELYHLAYPAAAGAFGGA